jgi:hypothetical protein
VYGNLNLKGTEHKLQWMAQRPFRPFDLLLWGADSTTYLRSFAVGLMEQIAMPGPVLQVLREPWFPVESLSGGWQDGLHEPGELRDLLDGVRLSGHLKLRVNPGLVFATASPGVVMRLHLTGPLQHAIVYGVSVD